MTPLQLKILDFVRDATTEKGYSPTVAEIALETGTSENVARSAVDALIRSKRMRENRDGIRKLEVADFVDLTAVGTSRLRAELARRGEILDGMVKPRPVRGGRPCTAENCGEKVPKGHLFCRPHWHMLTKELQDAIFDAFRRKDEEAYSLAIEAAREHIRNAEAAHV